eukprot:5283483-Prymnesium_polylepis.1
MTVNDEYRPDPHIEFLFWCPATSSWLSVRKVTWGDSVNVPVSFLSSHVPNVGSAGLHLVVQLGGSTACSAIEIGFDLCAIVKYPQPNWNWRPWNYEDMVLWQETEKCGADLLPT